MSTTVSQSCRTRTLTSRPPATSTVGPILFESTWPFSANVTSLMPGIAASGIVPRLEQRRLSWKCPSTAPSSVPSVDRRVYGHGYSGMMSARRSSSLESGPRAYIPARAEHPESGMCERGVPSPARSPTTTMHDDGFVGDDAPTARVFLPLDGPAKQIFEAALEAGEADSGPTVSTGVPRRCESEGTRSR